MSLSVDGFWKAGFWSQTFWSDGFWYEGAVVSGTGGGSARPYRYIPVSHDLVRKKHRITKEEEDELKLLLLESEEKQRKQIVLLEKRSADLYQKGVALSKIRSDISDLKAELERDFNARIDFDINLQIRLMENRKKRAAALLLLIDSAN